MSAVANKGFVDSRKDRGAKAYDAALESFITSYGERDGRARFEYVMKSLREKAIR